MREKRRVDDPLSTYHKSRSKKWLVDKPNSVLFRKYQSTQGMRQPFLWATYPSRLHVCELERATLVRLNKVQSKAGSTWSCTGRGFSCPQKSGSHLRPTSLLTMRWSLTPPFHLFLNPFLRRNWDVCFL